MIHPPPFVWPDLLVFWSVFIWVFIPEGRVFSRATKLPVPPKEDRGSLRVVTLGFSAAIVAAMLSPYLAPWASLPGERRAWLFAGLCLLVAGSLLRRHCFRMLGVFFTGAVTIQEGHRVVESGAYRWVRHPSYTAALAIVLGFALAFANGLGVLVALLAAFPAYAYRARVEEQALLDALGAPYERFLATRRRFFPGIY